MELDELAREQQRHDEDTTILRSIVLTTRSPQHPENPRIVIINTQSLVTEYHARSCISDGF